MCLSLSWSCFHSEEACMCVCRAYMYPHASEFATNNIERRAQQATKHTYGYILLYKSSVIFKTRTLRSPLSQSSYIKSLAFVIFNVTVKFRLSLFLSIRYHIQQCILFYNLAFKSFKPHCKKQLWERPQAVWVCLGRTKFPCNVTEVRVLHSV